MGRSRLGRNKANKLFQGKEVFQRMNFLFQASEFLTTRLKQPSLAAYYGSQMTSLCKKSVLRMEPKVKRQLCKGCRAPLVPGLSSRIRANSQKNLVITCLQCGTIKRFPMKPGYRVWVEVPEACSEILTGETVQTENVKSKSIENPRKDNPKHQGQPSTSGGTAVSKDCKNKNYFDKMKFDRVNQLK